MQRILPCSLVGSYPQPNWLINREKLASIFPPRARMSELWRVDENHLEEAMDDAAIIAIRDQERAGLDIITDGEVRRESYSNYFANALEGIDLDHPGVALDRSGHKVPAPRVAGKIGRPKPVQLRDARFLRASTDRQIKMTVPGPFTMTQQAQNDYYKTRRELALAYAEVVRQEIEDLFAAGVDVVQIDEPYMEARSDDAREYGIDAVNAALEGVKGRTAVHICFGYAALIHERPAGYHFLPEFEKTSIGQVSIETAQSRLDCSVLSNMPTKEIILGVLDLSTLDVESPQVVAERIHRALPYVDVERIIIAPDCGLKYLPREVAFGKMEAMVKGAERVRKAL